MKAHLLPSTWIALIILLVAPVLSFGALLPPQGLDPGDTYRLIFVTSQGTTATSSDISDYNGFVNNVANNLGGYTGSVLAALGTTSAAIGSTASVDARDNIGTFSDSVYLLDGTLVAAGSSGLWGGSLLHAISLNETGTVTSSAITNGPATATTEPAALSRFTGSRPN